MMAALATFGVAGCDRAEPPKFANVSDVEKGRPFFDPTAAAESTGAGTPDSSAGATAKAPASKEPVEVESDDPAVRFGWTRDKDGYIELGFMDLTLEGLDQELLVEKLIYPEDYADTDLEWPPRIRALDGEKVALTGYMIAMRWEGTTVPHFMLVRDLMSCCFGGAPLPHEWADVQMKGKGAGYWSYVPVITRGIFRLQGITDEAGYPSGAYTIEGHDARREL